jgi:2',3'-cyclic-nucleotide 2'-phosphodiesterase (5'-nucleotidase family)
MRSIQYILIAASVLLTSCTTVQHVSKVNAQYSSIGQDATETDQEIDMMVAPYKVQLDSKMNEIIATLGADLVKRQPESTMGNWVADGMLWGANQDNFKADFAISNYGGMRVPVISAGPLTVGEMYELSPFDNLLLIVDVPGNIVDTLFQYIASRDGWPVSKNIKLAISQKKLISATINGAAVDPGKIYKVAMPDYVANGGDDAHFLIPLPRVSTDKMQRNVLIDFARNAGKSGEVIYTRTEGRIVNQ